MEQQSLDSFLTKITIFGKKVAQWSCLSRKFSIFTSFNKMKCSIINYNLKITLPEAVQT